jgi:hypothetical protein
MTSLIPFWNEISRLLSWVFFFTPGFTLYCSRICLSYTLTSWSALVSIQSYSTKDIVVSLDTGYLELLATGLSRPSE